MASGGLPPQHILPPLRGRTPGATSDVAQNLSDEEIAKRWWEPLDQKKEDGREIEYSEKCDRIYKFWTFLSSDPIAKRLDTPTQADRVKRLIRMHQMLVVDPKWVEEAKDDLKQRLKEKMSIAADVVKKFKRGHEYKFLKECHPNAWTPPKLGDILSGKTNYASTDYFLGECYDVCMRRLQVLLESNLDIPAYNLTRYLVQNVFEDYQSKRPKFSYLHHEWLDKDMDKAHNILDVHIAIIYKRKEDTSQLQYLLKSLPIEAVVRAVEKCRDRGRSAQSNWISSLWSDEVNTKAGKAMAEFAMCAAARKKLETGLIKKIVSAWIRILKLDANDSTLDLEVEKFVAIDDHSMLSYIIGHRLIKEYGKVKLELSLEQIVHGLCTDINTVEVARAKDDDPTMKKAEESLSYGLQTLAQVMGDHIAFRRECILTAFSLTPREDLFKQIEDLAQHSGFKKDTKSEDMEIDNFDLKNINHTEFEGLCQDFIESLQKGFGTASTKLRVNSVLVEKKERNLEGLISIQGDLVTQAKNYNPVAAPLKTMTAEALGIKKPHLVDDLLTMINAPRWHLLSWVLDWAQLEEQCQALLRNPDIKRPTKELKYLVIDYTQFDEWSSEEEITATTGIEKGFESWNNRESDDDEEETIEEKGIDPSEHVDFNVVPILQDMDESDEYVKPEDYLKKESFLAEEEGATAVRSDLAEATKKRGPDCSLRGRGRPRKTGKGNTEDSRDSSTEDVRAKLARVVPGLNDLTFAQQPKNTEYEVRVVQVTTTSSTSGSSPSPQPSTSTAAAVSVSSSGSTFSSSVTSKAAAPSTSESSSKATPSAATTIQVSKERKVQYVYKQGGQTVLIDYPMSEDTYSKLKHNANSTSNNTVVVKQSAISAQPKILMSTSVDSLANSLISQITTPVNVSTPSSAATSTAIAVSVNGSNNSEQIVSESKQIANNGTLPKFQFAFGQKANSTSGAQPQIIEGTAVAKAGTSTPNGTGLQRQLNVTNPQGVTRIIQAVSPAKVQYSTIMRPATASIPVSRATGGVSVVVPVVTVEGGSAQTVIANARNILATQQQQTTPGSTSASSGASTYNDSANADLIRQLNVARAQGDVVLQHWGDKQVLVHKATGRWIMRQGNRLVTVPPQALGITTTSQGVAVQRVATQSSSSTTTENGSTTTKMGQTIVRSMSSSTMEQLAEFDSILESKFKSSSPSPPAVSLPDVVASTTSGASSSKQQSLSGSNGPTFVIIAPSSSGVNPNTFMTTGSKNIVAVSMGPNLKRSESTETLVSAPSAVGTTKAINGTLKISTSAPNSPVKTASVKLQSQPQPQTSISASASPTSTQQNSAAAGFVKPPPKPAEDPDTLKRIQQILDDYNEQIRNSPDLQNRPAPRRRTNGPPNSTATSPPPGVPSAVSPTKKRPSLSSGSPNSSSGSESPSQLMIQSSQNDSSGYETSSIMSSATESSSPSAASQSSTSSSIASSGQSQQKPVLRQIMVPPALAASLHATGKQLVFITGSGGKKIIAMRPLSSATPTGTSTSTPIQVGSTVVKTITRTSGVTGNSRVAPISLSSNISSNSPPQSLVATTLSSAASSLNNAPNDPNVCSPSCSPPSMGSSVDERPVTPILGIPMEMTPGQIMEAEISASTLGLEDDDQAVQPQEPATSSSSLRLQDQDHLGSETLPEDLFTSDVNPQPPSPAAAVQTQVLHKPPVITEETEVDTDEVEDEASNATSTTVALTPVVTKTTGTRKRPGAPPLQGGATDLDSSPTPGKRGMTPMRTRQRNISSNMKKSGIGITESSRSSIISSKKS